MSIERDDDALVYRNLGYLYYSWKKYELSQEYYITSINKGYNAMPDLETLFRKKSLELYHVLTKISKKNSITNNKINKLKKNKRIICFENKKRNLSKINECPICFENTKLIPRECTHYYCYDCYVKIKKCAICRI